MLVVHAKHWLGRSALSSTERGIHPTSFGQSMLYPKLKLATCTCSQLVRFWHMHTLHMLCNIKTKDFEWQALLA